MTRRRTSSSQMFIANFEKFETHVGEDVRACGAGGSVAAGLISKSTLLPLVGEGGASARMRRVERAAICMYGVVVRAVIGV